MDLSAQAQLIASDLDALGRLGDQAIADAAERLAAAMVTPLRSRILEMLGQVAVEIDTSDGAAHAELRVSGTDARIVVIAESGGDAPLVSVDQEADARISLRLPAALKQQVDSAAAAEGVSVNTWIVRRLQIQQAPRSSHNRRMTGYGRA